MARLIRASEVGEYVYCHRAWWLRTVEGLTPARRERLRAGERRHRRHGRVVVLSRLLLMLGAVLLLSAMVGWLLQP